ncbi:MAG: DegV family protein [Acidimicrobiales bacterium]
MAGIHVVTDSTCDLPQALADENGITIVPLTVRFGEEEFADRCDLSPDEFWERCAGSDQPPQTAAPAPGRFEEVFREAFRTGADGVVCATISAQLSATCQSARTAVRVFGDAMPVAVIDSQSASLGLGLIVLEAARRANGGGRLAEVTAAAEAAVRRCRVYAVLDTGVHLERGGRMASAPAVLGSVLSIKPTVELRDGSLVPGPKQRTRSKALRFLADCVPAGLPIEHVGVTHSAAPDIDHFLGLLSRHVAREQVLVADLSPVIGAHLGPRTISVAYLRDAATS